MKTPETAIYAPQKFRTITRDGRVNFLIDLDSCKRVPPEHHDKEFNYQGHKLAVALKNGDRLCAFTGHTDRAGKDIYVGDVLMNDFGTLDVVVEVEDSYRVATLRFDNQPASWSLGDTEGLDELKDRILVVGHRWEPADALRARAEDMDYA